jgi:hypothetical protein
MKKYQVPLLLSLSISLSACSDFVAPNGTVWSPLALATLIIAMLLAIVCAVVAS